MCVRVRVRAACVCGWWWYESLIGWARISVYLYLSMDVSVYLSIYLSISNTYVCQLWMIDRISNNLAMKIGNPKNHTHTHFVPQILPLPWLVGLEFQASQLFFERNKAPPVVSPINWTLGRVIFISTSFSNVASRVTHQHSCVHCNHSSIWTILMPLIAWYIEWRWAFTDNNVWGVVLKVSSTFLPYSFHLVVIWKVRYDEFISYHDSYEKSLSVFYFWMNTLSNLHYICLAY